MSSEWSMCEGSKFWVELLCFNKWIRINQIACVERLTGLNSRSHGPIISKGASRWENHELLGSALGSFLREEGGELRTTPPLSSFTIVFLQPLPIMLSLLGMNHKEGHEYQAPKPTGTFPFNYYIMPFFSTSVIKDARSPCPFLNAMANHVSTFNTFAKQTLIDYVY